MKHVENICNFVHGSDTFIITKDGKEIELKSTEIPNLVDKMIAFIIHNGFVRPCVSVPMNLFKLQEYIYESKKKDSK